MSSLYDSKYADKYENNKYIWENETDKNSEVAKKANAENEAIRKELGIQSDTMNYDAYRNARANHSEYYDMAKRVKVDPKYKMQSDRLYDQINNFSYDANSDPAYKAYAEAINRESASAQKSAYANMTKASGGRNNSYAAAATSQVAQNYGAMISEKAKNLANEVYDKLVEKYKIAVDRQKQAQAEADAEYNKYMDLGDADVQAKRNTLKDQMDYKNSQLDYEIKSDKYKAQLIENGILNEKNLYEYERWKQDPYYEIKDKKLAEAIGEYNAYSYLKDNGRDFLYSKFY